MDRSSSANLVAAVSRRVEMRYSLSPVRGPHVPAVDAPALIPTRIVCFAFRRSREGVVGRSGDKESTIPIAVRQLNKHYSSRVFSSRYFAINSEEKGFDRCRES